MSSTADHTDQIGAPKAGDAKISVIMPVYNGRDYIQQSLPPLIAMRDRGAVSEVIVANDGSTDGSEDLAEELGATVIHVPGPLGPGAARNVAVDMAQGDLAWFVDADVVVPQETADHIGEIFTDPSVVAAFGSYDDSPPGKNFASQYKNLVHHYYHHQSEREATTFWAGCGIVRRAAFRRISGFDVKRYRRPSIEDIELGYRLRADGGRIMLDPKLQCKHLKIWTIKSVISTDFFQRALPWSRLMLARGGLIDDLNVGKAERFRAALAGLLALSFGAPLAGTQYWGVTAAMVLAVLAVNAGLLALFTRRNGPLFGLAGLLFHQISVTALTPQGFRLGGL
jgi:GT2 family glycosyltransferase